MFDDFVQTITQNADEEKAESRRIEAQRAQATAESRARLEQSLAERKKEYDTFKQKQGEADAVKPPVFQPPPTPPNTQEMLKPTTLERQMGIASIFALLSVGIAKGHAIYGLKAFSGFMAGAHSANVEQAEASIKDFHTSMERVKQANEQAQAEYNAIFSNKKLSLEEQQQAVRLKALEFQDQSYIESLTLGGIDKGHDFLKERAKINKEVATEILRAKQYEQQMAHWKAMEAKGAGGGGGVVSQSVLGIPMATIPPAAPGQKNEAFLQMLPPTVADMVRGVANGDIDVKSFGGMGKEATQRKTEFTEAARIYDPTFQTRRSGVLEKAEKELTPGGRVGTNTLAINTLPHHIDQFAEAFKGLNNSQLRKWNSTKNRIFTEFGDPALKKVRTTAYVVAEELARVAKGGQASPVKDEVARFNEIFDTADSMPQMRVQMWEALKIAGGRLSAIEEVYRAQGMNKRVLTPEAAKLILKWKPKNEPTPDWLEPRKKNPADLSDLEKQSELSETEKDKIGAAARERVRSALPRARNPQTGDEWELRDGQWQLLPKR